MHIEHGLFRLHFFFRFWQSRHASFLPSLTTLLGALVGPTELMIVFQGKGRKASVVGRGRLESIPLA
jgi:hypothetical protein